MGPHGYNPGYGHWPAVCCHLLVKYARHKTRSTLTVKIPLAYNPLAEADRARAECYKSDNHPGAGWVLQTINVVH